MKAKTWWIIGAILFCAIVRSEIVTLLVLAALLIPQALKLITIAGQVDDPVFRSKYYED